MFSEEHYVMRECSITIIHLLLQVNGASDVPTGERRGCMEVESNDKPAAGALQISFAPLS